MSVHGFRYLMFNSKEVGPSIEAGYGPYSSVESAIQTIQEIFRDDSTAEAYTTTGYNPPLGLHFGVVTNGVFTEYEYKQGEFTSANVGTGIIPVGSGGTITDVKKGTTSSSITLVSNGIAYIPIVSTSVDGLMSKEDKGKLDSLANAFIEVVEPGIYNVDANFEVEPAGSSVSSNLEDKVNKIITILGDLYNDNATFTINE